jgi:hypothetical protein
MEQVRLVAYRQVTSGATTETSYELDLQESPNISLNFQFSDIKEPQTRKASYSQTFKLPFTDNNNDFFQNWFNVNMATLVFSTRQKFSATLFVGATPQFEGFIQLKAVYQKAQLYEVVLMSNTADLFSAVGENKLRDVFLQADGSYSAELDHTYNNTNIIASWNGASSSFQNSSGTSLQDSSAGVQKVMYPFSFTKRVFYIEDPLFVPNSLDMSDADIESIGIPTAQERMAPIDQFRPALQIKNILAKVIESAGFSYTSSFIDGSYFGKLFMTTGNQLVNTTIPNTNASSNPAGSMIVGNNGAWGGFNQASDPVLNALATNEVIPEDYITTIVPADTVTGSGAYDTVNIWNESDNFFTKPFQGFDSISVSHTFRTENVIPLTTTSQMYLKVWVEDIDSGEIYGDVIYEPFTPGSFSDNFGPANLTHSFNTMDMSVGASAYIKMTIQNAKFLSGGGTREFFFGDTAGSYTPQDLESLIQATWSPLNQGVFGGVVNVPFCIDDTILQKDFLLDIIQRFNLVIIPSQDDPTKLLIEPYNDYLAQGEMRSWTDKLDTSKEIIVKDTTTLQKKTIHLTDLEDVDLTNKTIKEDAPDVNVYGHYDRIESNNEFATGEFTNTPIFSPYINFRIPVMDGNDYSLLKNVVAQFEFTYKAVEGGYEYPLEATKPKLFYYCGTPTTPKNQEDADVEYYMHNQVATDSAINTYTFTTFPVCTPYDITPSSDAYTLTSANKSLYWNANAPVVGESDIFNYEATLGTWFDNTLYGKYWKPYFDSIYSEDARIMECYLYLDDVDIHNFQFNDEVFIKNTYWHVLNIHNYQVGVKTSTKVTLIKVVDTQIPCVDCDYVVGTDSTGSNLWNNYFYYWCPDTDPSCTPDVSGLPLTGILAPESCCLCQGGDPLTFINLAPGLFPCLANSGSFPLRLKSLLGIRSILAQGQVRSIFTEKLKGLKKQLVIGSDNSKFSRGSILPPVADDMVIKYKTKVKGKPQLNGEMHRIMFLGYTTGNTRGYAYPEGQPSQTKITIPVNTTTIIRITGTATVIGGTSSSYTIGTLEGFSYYTAFKNSQGTITQLGTTGGTPEFALKEASAPASTCTLYITTNDSELQFGLDDSQTDTRRIWSMSVDMSIQRINNMVFPYGDDWAIFQNRDGIQFMNYDRMLWN